MELDNSLATALTEEFHQEAIQLSIPQLVLVLTSIKLLLMVPEFQASIAHALLLNAQLFLQDPITIKVKEETRTTPK